MQAVICKILLRQLDAGRFKEYKLPNHPVGACQKIITIDKTNNRLQESKAASAAFFLAKE
jgi:hypothetical protein